MSLVHQPADQQVWCHRRFWARHLVRRGRALGQLPSYGSREWAALAGDDPGRIAAAVVAAECWAVAADDLVWTLRDDLVAGQRALLEARAEDEVVEEAKFATVAARVRALPGQMEARARRINADTAGPRPGDYRGGPVEWNLPQTAQVTS